ncbi:recombinase family protein [Streptomyces lincolnensis]|uniref:recombinase family protein n=1 Tax=Streptomyces lincolnensis TaxID=1915 RepID=UPI001E595B25|nr:recombinase family protein [Streptomyces lincolnensis]MCD7440370.1 recombinase family protein [Streptomyces lincolnensis]
MATHVGVYLRQSERRTTGSEASTAAQHEECLKALARWDIPPAHVEVYEDLGISAFKNVRRPAYERLLRDVRAGRINVIMVHYMSRLSRKNAAETYDELRPLLTNRVRIISVGEHREFHTDNPLALMELLFKLQANHEESLNKSRAIKAAKALEASLGGYTGKPPFGFTLVRETRRSADGKPISLKILTPDEEHEAPIVRRMVEIVEEWIATGGMSGSCWKLARHLEAEGHLTRGKRTAQQLADAPWDRGTVKRILIDPRIAGFACESVYGVRSDGTSTKNIAEYRIVLDDNGAPVPAYEPIVSPERWYRIQKWVADRHPGGGGWQGAPSGVLSAMKLLYCECGSYMTHGGTGSKKHYRCRRRVVKPGQHMGTVSIGSKGIEEYLARRVLAVIATAQDDEATTTVLAHASARYAHTQEQQESSQVAQERDLLLTERANLRHSRQKHHADKQRTMLKGGFIDAVAQDEWDKADRALAERMKVLDARIAELGDSRQVELPCSTWLPRDGSDPIGPGSWWDQATRDDKRAFFRIFLNHVEVRKAYRYAGQGVPTASRVSITWAGGVKLRESD